MEPDTDTPPAPDHAILRLAHLLTGASSKSPDEMNDAERSEYLAAHGVDTAKSREAFRIYLDRLQKKHSLQAAASRRAALLSGAGEATADLLARARAAVDRLMQSDPDIAKVYASKFENSDPADVASLLDDMLKLEAMHDDDGHHEDSGRKDQG